jgi:hypothetical protein
MQIGPFLASIECLVKVLKLIQPLIDVIKALPNLDAIALGKAVPKFLEAVPPVLDCVVSFTPLGLIPFIRDLLCLILKVLKCFLGQMKSILKIMEGTALQITIAESSGNAELLQSLQCAQNNAMMQANHLTSSLEAVGVILDLAGDLMQIVGVQPIKLPTLGSQADLDSLKQVVQTIQGVVATIQIVVDVLGGCQ